MDTRTLISAGFVAVISVLVTKRLLWAIVSDIGFLASASFILWNRFHFQFLAAREIAVPVVICVVIFAVSADEYKLLAQSNYCKFKKG